MVSSTSNLTAIEFITISSSNFFLQQRDVIAVFSMNRKVKKPAIPPTGSK